MAELSTQDRERIRAISRIRTYRTYRLLLEADAGLRAADVRELLGGTKGEATVHLRRLEEAGLASEAGGHWRGHRVPIHFPTDPKDHDWEHSERVLRFIADEASARREQWFTDRLSSEMAAWRDYAIEGDWTLYVHGPEDLAKIERGIREVLKEFGTPDPSATPVFMSAFGAPAPRRRSAD